MVFPAVTAGVWVLLLVTLRRVPSWFFAAAVGTAALYVVAGIAAWHGHSGEHLDPGAADPLVSGLIRDLATAMLGLLTALALAGLTYAVETIRDTRQLADPDDS